MLNGTGIFTYIWVVLGANVGKYTSPIEHLGVYIYIYIDHQHQHHHHHQLLRVPQWIRTGTLNTSPSVLSILYLPYIDIQIPFRICMLSTKITPIIPTGPNIYVNWYLPSQISTFTVFTKR